MLGLFFVDPVDRSPLSRLTRIEKRQSRAVQCSVEALLAGWAIASLPLPCLAPRESVSPTFYGGRDRSMALEFLSCSRSSRQPASQAIHSTRHTNILVSSLSLVLAQLQGLREDSICVVVVDLNSFLSIHLFSRLHSTLANFLPNIHTFAIALFTKEDLRICAGRLADPYPFVTWGIWKYRNTTTTTTTSCNLTNPLHTTNNSISRPSTNCNTYRG